MMTIIAIAALAFGQAMVVIGLLYWADAWRKKQKRKMKTMDWSCGHTAWSSCMEIPLDEKGHCVKCGKS